MNVAALKKTEIIRILALLPEDRLEQVRVYVDSILPTSYPLAQSYRSLKGIWQGKGFEKLTDLEGAIKDARKQLRESILERAF